MALTDARVQYTYYEDGSADFTITEDDEDFKFSITPDGNLTYEETQTWRGEIRVSDPPNEVWRTLMQSDKMTEYLDAEGLNSVDYEV